ncbi:MAG: FtsQ-type POTRA domain-containing protein [Ignavibacteriales bacterium]|nr:FtsQ-type POTRA domain-containing protein [Ignavibacteriales bacterium]
MKFKIDKDKWKNFGKVALCVLLFVGVGVAHYFAVTWSNSLHVKKISVSGNSQLYSDEILAQLNLQKDSLLFGFNAATIQQNILKHSWIRSAKITRHFPSKLSVEIIERTPVAMLTKSETQPQTLYVDSDGVVLQELDERKPIDVPIISCKRFVGKLECAENIPPQLRTSLAVANLVFTLHKDVLHSLSEIHTDANNDVVLFTLDGAVPILLGKNEMQEKLWKVSEFWKTTMRNVSVQYLLSVDARFKERIIVKWKSDDGILYGNGVRS